MTELEKKLSQYYKKEADKIMFGKLHFDSNLTSKVLATVDSSRNRVASMSWMALCRQKWAYAVAAIAIVAILSTTIPKLHNVAQSDLMENNGSSSSTPNLESEGTGLSSLKSVILQTPEEARQRFGPALLVPSFVPEGYQCTEIQAVAAGENQITQVIFTYTFRDQVFTLVEDKRAASLNLDFFNPITIKGVDGYMNKDPLITELYWQSDGIQFSIVGSLSKQAAIKVAESLQ